MRHVTLSVLGTGLLAGALCAQAAPGVIKAHADSKVFTRTQFEAQKIYLSTATRKYLAQIHMTTRAGLAAGKLITSMTVYGLDAKYGNTGQSNVQDFVLYGEYDEVADKYTPSTIANAMNDVSGGNFGLMIGGPLSQYAVVDHASGPFFSRRANFTQAFPQPVPIGGITASYVDPAVALYQGKLVLFWVNTYTNSQNLSRSRIVMSELDDSMWPTSVTIKGQGTIVADVTLQSSTTTINVHSPTPVTDATGNTAGLGLSERLGNDSDQFFKGDLMMAAGHQQQRYYDGSAWTNNGAMHSGTFYYADSESTVSPFYETIKQTGVAWMAITDVPIGGRGNIVMGMEDVNQGANIMVAFLAPSGLIPGVTVPGIGGQLGVDPAGLIVWGAAAIADATERTQLPLAIPMDNNLKGKSFAFQAVGIDPAASSNPQKLTLTNTAFLNIQ